MEEKTNPLERKALEVPRWFRSTAQAGLVATQLAYLSSSVALMMAINEEFPTAMELTLPVYMMGTVLGAFPVRDLYCKGSLALAEKVYGKSE